MSLLLKFSKIYSQFWVRGPICVMAGDPLRSKRKVMTGVIFSASNCHNQRPHYFIRHFDSYHEETNMHENDTNNAGNCLQEVLIMDLFEYFAFIMVVLV